MNDQRRNFLKKSGLVVLSMTVAGQALSHQGDTQHLKRGENGENLVVESGPGRLVPFVHHHHELHIPVAFIFNPPAEGVTLKTTWAWAAHRHTVVLTQQQLLAIRDQAEVVVEDTVKDHLFRIRLSSVRD